jgi:hypothetical protein
MRIRQLLQQMLLEKLHNYMLKTEKRSMSFSLTSIISKWIKDLNIRPQILKLMKERARNTLETIGKDNDFLNRT